MENRRRIALGIAILTMAACGDVDAPSLTAPPPLASGAPEIAANNALKRYVAIGTSVSMGWQSDGVNAALQSQS